MTPRDNNFSAKIDANVADLFTMFWHVVFNAVDYAVDTTILYDVKITYYTILTDPNNLNES